MTTLTAIYPGTFDPVTLGHEDVIYRASAVFDKLIVGVASAHHKTTIFNAQERVELIRSIVGHRQNISVMHFDGLLVDFVKAQGAQVVVRGLRSMTDYDFEVTLAGSNRILAPDIETFFMIPNTRLQHVSSSAVREISNLGGDVTGFVSNTVRDALNAKRDARGSHKT